MQKCPKFWFHVPKCEDLLPFSVLYRCKLKVPCGFFFCKQTKLCLHSRFLTKVHCVSQSDKCVECISFLRKHLQSCFCFLLFEIYIVVSMFTNSLLILCLCWHIVVFFGVSLPPAGDQWKSVKPSKCVSRHLCEILTKVGTQT